VLGDDFLEGKARRRKAVTVSANWRHKNHKFLAVMSSLLLSRKSFLLPTIGRFPAPGVPLLVVPLPVKSMWILGEDYVPPMVCRNLS
jgi:hypothetical protein